MIRMFIVSGIIIVIVLLAIFMINLGNKPPSYPEITYGEFPFRLEYEIDGERFVIEDIVIAEFERSIRGNMTAQARRIWNTRLKNGEGGSGHLGLSFVLRQIDDITITFNTGLAEYFMGDSESLHEPSPRIIVRDPNIDHLSISKRPENAYELLKDYGIILINWEYTPPIENRFE